MVILYLTITLHAPWCGSLKDKRSEIRRLTAAAGSKFNISVCESHEQDTHRIIGLSICALAFHRAQADSMAEEILRFVESATQAELISSEQEYR
ncbi:MAG: DUF503 domain-containing protein [Clostridiales bacterium]|nr:DUF503 domain-containing protein [Clostridiales bacterium]